MSEKEKRTAETLAKALEALPDEKKEFLLGYAEGVTAMAEKKAERDPINQSTERPA